MTNKSLSDISPNNQRLRQVNESFEDMIVEEVSIESEKQHDNEVETIYSLHRKQS